MHLNRKLSLVRFATADMKSTDIQALVASLPMESEVRQALELLKEIRDVGDVSAVEILLAMLEVCLNGRNEERY